MAATATTNPATNVVPTAATLNGTVNPDGIQARAYFEYGPTIAYGSQTGPTDVGSGSSPVQVARRVAGLAPGSITHYRVILDNDVIPPSAFGADLPARIGSSSGTVFPVTTLAQLNAAIAAVTPNDIISVNASINGGGSQLNVNCAGSPGNPITITSGGGSLSNFSQLYVTGSYTRFYQIPIHDCTLANIKITGGAFFIEVDGCEIYDSRGMGILVTANAESVQIWNNSIHDNGSNANLDHGIYFAFALGECVIGNNKVYHNWAYNIQVYPNSPNLILTCNTVDDEISQPQTRGGIVVGSNPGSPQTQNTVNVGMLTTNAVSYGISLYNPGPGNQTYDAIGFGNGAGDFQTGSGMTYTHCTHADPLYVSQAGRDYHLQGGSPAIDYIDPARYGLVPPTDIDGNPRVTADAGCYAA